MYFVSGCVFQKKGIQRCGKCRLNFLTYKEKVEHKTHFHRTHKKPRKLEGLPPGTKVCLKPHPLKQNTISDSIIFIHFQNHFHQCYFIFLGDGSGLTYWHTYVFRQLEQGLHRTHKSRNNQTFQQNNNKDNQIHLEWWKNKTIYKPINVKPNPSQ